MTDLLERPSRRVETLGINRRNLDYVFADYRPGKFRDLDDKLLTKQLMGEHDLPVPRTLDVITGPDDLERLPDILARLSDVVIKPSRGWGGRGIQVLTRQGEQWCKPDGSAISLETITAEVNDILSGIYSLDEEKDQALLEERVVSHGFFTGIYPRGLSDLRLVLDRGVPIQAMCRIPADASDGKANLHSGGVGLGVDIATGRTNGAVCHDRNITQHPDSGAPLIDLQMPHWDRCLDLARRSAQVLDLDYFGVDIVIDTNRGPLLLELNARPGLAIQLANGQPQPVAPRRNVSRAERVTFGFVWVLLAAMALLPPAFDALQRHHTSVSWVEVEAGHRSSSDGEATDSADRARDESFTRGELELPLSETSALFGRARLAVKAGDIEAGKTLYEAALADSALAPFALNNLALIARDEGQLARARTLLTESVARYPAYARGNYNLGLVLAALERPAEAMAAFRRTIALQPSHSGAWANLGYLHFERKDYSQAITALESAIRYNPGARSARLRLGLAHRLENDLPRAERRFAELLALNPASEPAAYWWSRTLRELDSSDRLARNISADSLIVVLTPHAAATPPSRRSQAQIALLQQDQGELPTAYTAFAELAAQGYQPRTHGRAAASLAVEMGQWDRAAAHLEQLRTPDEPAMRRLANLVTLGRRLDRRAARDQNIGSMAGDVRTELRREPDLYLLQLYAAGNVAMARAVYREWEANTTAPMWLAWLLDSAPSTVQDDELLNWLAADDRRLLDRPYQLRSTHGLPPAMVRQLLRSRAATTDDGALLAALDASLARFATDFRPWLLASLQQAMADRRYKTAIRLGRTLLRHNDGDHEAGLLLAEAHLRRNKPVRAQAQLSALPADVRRTTSARVLQGRIHLAAGRARKGLKELERAVADDPGDLDARLARAEALHENGRKKKAVAELTNILNQAPQRTDIRRTLAHQLMSIRRYADATREWRRVLKIDGDDLSARFNLALCLQRDKQFAASVVAYEMVITANPTNHKARFNRALALEELGRHEEALSGYRQVLNLVPDHAGSLARLKSD